MLATAKAAGPRHGDSVAGASAQGPTSVVDEVDAAVGLPRYLA